MSDRARGPSDGDEICIVGAYVFIDLIVICEKRMFALNSMFALNTDCIIEKIILFQVNIFLCILKCILSHHTYNMSTETIILFSRIIIVGNAYICSRNVKSI